MQNFFKYPIPIIPPNPIYLHTTTTPPRPRISTQVVDWIPAQGTRVLVAALEPLVETGAVEQILAGLASLVRHLLVCADDAVANGTLGLALECADDVAPECGESIYNAPALYL